MSWEPALIKVPVFAAYLVIATGSWFFAAMVFRRDLLADPPELRGWASLVKFALLSFLSLSLTGFMGILLIPVFDSFVLFIFGVILGAFGHLVIGTVLALEACFVPGSKRAHTVRMKLGRSRPLWGRDYVSGPLAGIDGLFRYEPPRRPGRRQDEGDPEQAIGR